MIRGSWRLLSGGFLGLFFGLVTACGGPSEEDCRAACEVAAAECTDPEVMEKCVDRCQDEADDEQVQRAKENCGDYGSCSSGLCCAGFYYDEAGKERNCNY